MITKITSGCRRSWTNPRHHKVFSDQLLYWSSAVLDRCKADKSGSESIDSSISHILTARDVSKSFQACKNTMVCQSDVSCWICAVLIKGMNHSPCSFLWCWCKVYFWCRRGRTQGPGNPQQWFWTNQPDCLSFTIKLHHLHHHIIFHSHLLATGVKVISVRKPLQLPRITSHRQNVGPCSRAGGKAHSRSWILIYPHPYLVNTVGSSGILAKGGHSPALQNPGKRSGVSVVVGIVVGSVVSSSPSSSCSAKCNCGGPSWM